MCQDCGQKPLRSNNRSGFCPDCYEKNRPRNKRGSAEWLAHSEQQKQHYNKKIVQRRHYQRQRKYGLTLEQYHEMLRAQNYACALCERRLDELDGSLNVDHDHDCCPTTRENSKTCGKCIRKLLCTDCNQGLGNFKDDPELLDKAIKYLLGHRPV